MNAIVRSTIILGFATLAASDALAQAIGTDMWTKDLEQRGLYTPHKDYCNSSTEAFVAVAGSDRGFCIEKDDRSAAAFEDAREDCAADGKRLPEPVEWKVACQDASALGLVDMVASEDWEWASNFAHPRINPSTHSGYVSAVIAGGGGGCHSMADNIVGGNPAAESTRGYRCVR